MNLCIDVTWPVTATLCLPQSEQLADGLHRLALRPDLLLVEEDTNRLHIRGLFGCENKIPDVDRYGICADNVPPGFAIYSHHRTPPYISTYPYGDRPPIVGHGVPQTLLILLESPHRDEYGRSVTDPSRLPAGPRARVSIASWAGCSPLAPAWSI